MSDVEDSFTDRPTEPGTVPDGDQLTRRREAVFLVLAGLFLGTLSMLNILGTTRFVNVSPFAAFSMIVPVGVLPYPITFLCTDLISELYGKRRASQVVWVGLLLNIWVLLIMWFGGVLPGTDASASGEIIRDEAGRLPLFFEIRTLTLGCVAASMIAYLAAQFIDVHMFHFWKRLTGGRHLWLRNNASTLVSQLVDTTAVLTLTHVIARGLPINESLPVIPQLAQMIAAAYVFKLASALIDTVPFYVLTAKLRNYLGVDDGPAHVTAA